MLTVNCIYWWMQQTAKAKREFGPPAEFLLPGLLLASEGRWTQPKIVLFFSESTPTQKKPWNLPLAIFAAVELNCCAERSFRTNRNKKTIRDHARLSTRCIYSFRERAVAGRYSSAINACPVNAVNLANKKDISLYMGTTIFFFHFLLFCQCMHQQCLQALQ